MAAASSGGTTAAMQLAVQNFIEANLPEHEVDVETTVDTRKITVEASLALPLSAMALVGKPSAEITVVSVVESAEPLRRTGAGKHTALDERRIEQARRRFEKMVARLPHSERIALKRQFERYVQRIRISTSRPGQAYLAE